LATSYSNFMEWKSSSLVYETSNPRDKHVGELFSVVLLIDK
jgi:hypothetical protein